jgi:hypothetical protein
MILRILEAALYIASLSIAGQIGRGARKLNQPRDTQDR